MPSEPFNENAVVLTGASSGIGRHLALQLAEQGAWLALAARGRKKLNEVAGLCQTRGGSAIAVPTDVGKQDQCRRLIEQTLREYGRIDTLINNAGISMQARFDELQDVGVIEELMRVNFLGGVYCTFFALPHLKHARGRIVGVSSYGGKFPAPTASGYGASKHAMAGFFDSLRVELTETGVSVTMVYFSWVATGISSRALRADGKPSGEALPHEENALPADECAQKIIRAAADRQRELLPLHGRFGLWMKLLNPAAIDREALKTLS